MNIFHFFISTSGLNTQTSNAFGPMTPVSGVDYYRVNSLHSSTSAETAYAICSGQIVIQRVTDTSDVPAAPALVNVIVKPTQDEQTSVRFPQIKYIIYKGILRDSIIDGSDNIPADTTTNTNDLTNRIKANQTNINAALNIAYAPASSSVLADDKIDTTPLYSDDDPIDHLFYDPGFALNIIHGGESFGLFYPGLFGIEIILESPTYNPELVIARKIGHVIDAPTLIPTATEAQIFENRNQKEKILHFMDPCAFFGAFYTSNLNVFDGTAFVPLTGNDVYDTVLMKYLNKNKVYIDIRNEHNKAFNYYRNYSDTISVVGNATNPDVDYYRSGWPILIWDQGDFIQGIPGFKNDIAIQLPKGDNVLPLVFVSQGFVAQSGSEFKDFSAPTNKMRFVDRIAPDASDTVTQQFVIETPNYTPNSSVTTPVSTYIKLRYYKRIKPSTISNYELLEASKYDNIFLPALMESPFPTTTGVTTKIFREEVLIEEPGMDTGFFLGSIGLGVDQTHVTYFLFPSVKVETDSQTGADENVISITSESTTTESYFIRMIEKRYRSESQNSILNTAGQLRFSSAHSTDFQILQFRDDSPDDLLFVPLSKDFFAIIIDKTTSYADILAQAATLHPDFDVRMCVVNPDSYGSIDDADRSYSSFELSLRGYTVSGITATEIQSGTTANVEVFSYKNGLLYRDVASPEIAPVSGIVDEDNCSGTLLQSELELLKEFINDLQTAAYYVTPAHIPSKILYDQVVTGSNTASAPRLIDVPEAIPGPYTLQLPSDTSIFPTGAFAEFVFTFTIFKLTRQLEQVIVGDPLKADSLQPEIYQKLKDVLIATGRYQDPTTKKARDLFNRYFIDPSIPLNKRVDLLSYAIFKKPNTEPTSTDPKENISYHIVFGSPDIRDSLTPPPVGSAVAERTIKEIPHELSMAAQGVLKRDARCLYNYILPNEPKPLFDMLGAGTGAGTASILNRTNYGILFYNHTIPKGLIAKTSNTQSYVTYGDRAQTVVHIGSYGISYTPHANDPSLAIPAQTPQLLNIRSNYNYLTVIDNNSNVMRFGSRLYQLPSDWPNQSVRWQPIQLNGAFPTADAKNQPMPGANTTFQQIGTTNIYNVQDSSSNVIAVFDFDKQDLTFTSRDRFTFRVQVNPRFGFMSSTISNTGVVTAISANTSTYDEIAASVCVAKVIGPALPIHVPGTFGNDRFELLNSVKDTVLVTPGEEAELDIIIDAIIRGVPMYFNLQGNFIGYYVGPDDPALPRSQVRRDGNYSLIRNDEQTNPNIVIPNAAKIKYSFASVSYSGSAISFTVESYASPLVSRLDKRFLGDMLDGSGTPATDTFDYRSPSFNSGRKLDIDLHTHYGQLPLTSLAAYPDPNTSMGSGYKFSSYNQVLTALRSFGVLEAIFYRIAQRAIANGVTGSNLITLKSRLYGYIFVDAADGPVAATVYDVTTGERKFLTAEQYQFFKWYTSSGEATNYDVTSLLT